MPGKNVVAPAVVEVAPVIGLVHQLLGGAGDLAVFHQAHFHLVDAAGQGPCVQALQACGNGLGVDQQPVAVNLDRGLAIGRDVNGVDARLGIADHQAVGAAVHHAHGGVGARAERTQLPGQAFGVRREIAQAQELTVHFTLGVQRVHGVVEGIVIRAAQARELHVQHLVPIAQAAAGVQPQASAQVLALAATDIQLVTHDQARAAARGQGVVLRFLPFTLGILGEQCEQGLFQVVVHRQQLIRAATFAGPQRHTLLEVVAPAVALDILDHTAFMVSEIQQGQAVVAGEDNHRLRDELLIQFDPYRQRHIKKMLFEVRR